MIVIFILSEENLNSGCLLQISYDQSSAHDTPLLKNRPGILEAAKYALNA